MKISSNMISTDKFCSLCSNQTSVTDSEEILKLSKNMHRLHAMLHPWRLRF